MVSTMMSGRPQILTVHQRLPTSGARTVVPFELDDRRYLAIPQLATDMNMQAPHMNGGDSDTQALIYRWQDGYFTEAEKLPVPGGEDIAFFRIEGERFLAAASLRTGQGPYDLNVFSKIYRREGHTWTVFQEVPTFAAKRWRHFQCEGRHFLALAQGVTIPEAVARARHPRQSCILEWDGRSFVHFQTLDGAWGYNWEYFELAGTSFLAYADHTSASYLYRWDGEHFIPFQRFAEQGGRAFLFFEAGGSAWLAVANIDGESILYRWDGRNFVGHQVLGGAGGREFELIRANSGLYLVRICFIEGTPASPKTDLKSQIYQWREGRFEIIEEFATFGGTNAAAFEADGARFLAVSNSLTPDVRFREDTIIYRATL
jgi:EPTP domain